MYVRLFQLLVVLHCFTLQKEKLSATNRYNPVSSAITLAAMNALEMLIIHCALFLRHEIIWENQDEEQSAPVMREYRFI